MWLLDKLRSLLLSFTSRGGQKAEPTVTSGNRVTVRRRRRMREGFVTWPSRPAFPPQLCRVEDVSFSGACIELDTPTDAGFWTSGARLYLATEGHEFQCRLAWQRGRQIGLQFQGRPQPPSRAYV